jgi:cytochrome c oxidase subunit 4
MRSTVRRSHVARVLVVLLALAGLSWALALVPLGGFGVYVALGIATAKASLVALFFMELADAPATLRIAAVLAPSLVALLVGLALADVLSR